MPAAAAARLAHPSHPELSFSAERAPPWSAHGSHLWDEDRLFKILGVNAMCVWREMTKHRDRGHPHEERTLRRLAEATRIESPRMVKKALATLRRFGLEQWEGRQWALRPVGRCGALAKVAFPRRSVVGARCVEACVPAGVERRTVWSVPAMVDELLRTQPRRGRPRRLNTGPYPRPIANKNDLRPWDPHFLNTGPYPPPLLQKNGSTNRSSLDLRSCAFPKAAAAQQGAQLPAPTCGGLLGKAKAGMPAPSMPAPGIPAPAPTNPPPTHPTTQPPARCAMVPPVPTPRPPTPLPPAPTPVTPPPSAPTGCPAPHVAGGHQPAPGAGVGVPAPTPSWRTAPGGGVWLLPTRSAPYVPLEQRLLAARAPPFPCWPFPSTPGAPQIPDGLTDLLMAQHLVAAYRTAMSALAPRGRHVLLGANLRRWSGYAQLVDAARMLAYHGIPPISWVSWRQGWWRAKNGPGIPVPVKVAFSLEAISAQHGWWQDPCEGGQMIIDPHLREATERYQLMRSEIAQTSFTGTAADQAIVERWFPPGLWQELREKSVAAGAATLEELRARRARGEWIEGWR